MKVFLSSTYADLIEHRRAAHDTLEQLGLQVIWMEAFGARPVESTIACLNEVEESDLFIGIYAYRYGYIPEGADISITEQEFNHAQKLGKPIFGFVVKDDYRWPPENVEHDKEDKLKAFLYKVKKQPVGFFTTPDNLAKNIASSVGRYLKEHLVSEAKSVSILEKIQQELDKGKQLFDNADYQAAANLYGEVARSANSAKDAESERKARHMAVRALDTYLVLSHIDENERKGVLQQINDHLQILESLAIDSDILGIDKARLALLSNESQEALQIVQKVIESASVGSVIWVDALLTCIQAYWQSEQIDDALGMKDLVRKALSKKVEAHARIAMAATWLRTKIKAGKVTRRDVLRFINLVRELKGDKNIGAKKAMMIVGEVAAESNRKVLHEHTLALLELAFELGEEVAEPAMASSAGLQIAEVAIYANESSKVKYISWKSRRLGRKGKACQV